MAKFHGILPFFSNVQIAYRGGEWDLWEAGSVVGDGKNPMVRTPLK